MEQPKIRIVTIDMAYITFALRCIAYITAWAVFGEVSIPGAIAFAIGAGVVEAVYYIYKRYTRKNYLERFKDELDFFLVASDGTIKKCTMEETIAQLSLIADEIKADETITEGIQKKAPYYKHTQLGPIHITANWIGASKKGNPVQPWGVTVRATNQKGSERSRDFASWEEAEAEFDRVKTKFEAAVNAVQAVTKTPTIH